MKSRQFRSQVSSRDVARYAGVSQATVSRVVNRKGNVSEETLRKVLAAIHELSYRPNVIAQSLVTQRTRSIGLVVADILNPFYPELVDALEAVAMAEEYNLLLCITNHGTDKEKQHINSLLGRKVDGIIFSTIPIWSKGIHIVLESGIPMVITNRRLESYDTDYVVVDNARGAYEMTQYLLSLGHRRIAFVQGRADASTSIDRETGYRVALKEAGVKTDSDLIASGGFSHEGGYMAVRELLHKQVPPTAIFCANDAMAFGALDAALDMGLHVPKDVSLAGFDDVRLASYRSIALTTVRQPIAQMAEEAMRILASRIEKGDTGERIHRVLPAEIVIRKTVGPNRA